MTGNINVLSRRAYDTRSYGASSIGSGFLRTAADLLKLPKRRRVSATKRFLRTAADLWKLPKRRRVSATKNGSKWSQNGYVKQDCNNRPQSASQAIQSGRLCPRRFLERYSLPRVVRVVPQDPGDCNVLSGHLLMYSHYRAGKVEARSHSRLRGSSTLVIPENYQGWFSVVTERGQMKARCYTTMHRLVSSQVTSFLIVNDVTAYTLNSRTNMDGRRQQYTKTTVAGGQILKLIAVYQDLGAQTAKSKRLSWPLLTRTDTSRYAQCLTSTDQVLFIPLTTAGQFYAVASAANTNEDTVSKVYQLPKLLRTFPLPVRVCIVNSCKPQGSMLLENYRKEEVILTCLLDAASSNTTVDEKHFRLLEIDLNSKFFVLRPTERLSDERRLFQSDRVQSALRFCHENWEKWSRQLKVIHHIYPREVSPAPHPPGIPPQVRQTPVHNPSSQQRRKLSLGDKKTVKSASFRFSTSYQAEELRATRPLPQRPDADQEHIYSNVPDEESSGSDDCIKKPTVCPAPKPRDRSYCTRITINETSSEIGSYDGLRKALDGFKPFYRTRLHVGSETQAELPYSAVRDEIRREGEEEFYAEIGSVPAAARETARPAVRFQRYRFSGFGYQSSSDGTYSGTSSSNATSSMS